MTTYLKSAHVTLKVTDNECRAAEYRRLIECVSAQKLIKLRVSHDFHNHDFMVSHFSFHTLYADFSTCRRALTVIFKLDFSLRLFFYSTHRFSQSTEIESNLPRIMPFNCNRCYNWCHTSVWYTIGCVTVDAAHLFSVHAAANYFGCRLLHAESLIL